MKPIKIPIYQLFVHPLDLSELKKDIWNNDPLPATLTIQKKRYDIDLALRGAHIRKFPKKSFHVQFYKPKTYKGVKEIHLNAEYKDPSMIRNKLSLDFFKDIGVHSPQCRHIFLKVNSQNSGIYLELESVDRQFLMKRGLPDGPIFYAVNGDANFSLMSDVDKKIKTSLTLGYERKYGLSEDNAELEKFIYQVNTMLNNEFEKEINQYLDIDRYLRYLAGIIFTQNYDGFVHNYALYQNRETGLFEVFPWDYDATWGRDINGKYMREDFVSILGYNTLTARLLHTDKYRKQYQLILKNILNEQFHHDYLKPKIDLMYESLEPFITQDPYKDEEEWIKEPQRIYDYIEGRRKYISTHLDILN